MVELDRLTEPWWASIQTTGAGLNYSTTEPFEMDEIYSASILKLAAGISRVGRLSSPEATCQKMSRVCGSRVLVDICMASGSISEFAQQIEACALGQASAAVLAKNVIGASLEDLIDARDSLRRMLQANGPPPQGRFAELSALQAVRAYPARHQSTLLPFEVTIEACLNLVAPLPSRIE